MRYLIVLLIFLIPLNCGAAELHVPGTYATIQLAINAATSGDEVIVANGTYTGAGNINLSFGAAPNDFTVRAANPLGAIIDGQGTNNRGFYLHNSEGNDSAIEGFIIQNFDYTGSGAGVYFYACAPTIRNCWIKDNSASGEGGGVYLNTVGSSPLFEFCLITGCSSPNAGGGIFSAPGTVSSLKNCTITGNSANYCSGIYSTGSSISIVNIIIYGNTGTTSENLFNSGTTPTYSLYDYVKTTGDTPGTGCLDGGSVDPLFRNSVGGDFQLKGNSPCINAGTVWPVDGDGDQYDLAGRKVWDDATDSAVGPWKNGAEIGAYGFTASGGSLFPGLNLGL